MCNVCIIRIIYNNNFSPNHVPKLKSVHGILTQTRSLKKKQSPLLSHTVLLLDISIPEKTQTLAKSYQDNSDAHFYAHFILTLIHLAVLAQLQIVVCIAKCLSTKTFGKS